MNVTCRFDPTVWVALPRDTGPPPAHSDEGWIEQTAESLLTAWNEPPEGDLGQLVKLALANALNTVDPTDSMTLQFWPGGSLANVIVRVATATWAGDDQPGTVTLEEIVGDGASVSIVESPGIGEGVEIIRYQAVNTEPPSTAAAIDFLFHGPSGWLTASTDVTLMEMVALVREPLRQLLGAAEIEMAPGTSWKPTVVDARFLVGATEEWQDRLLGS